MQKNGLKNLKNKTMTTKEKAEKLIRKYYTWGINKEGQTLSWLESKQCALIAVNNIIAANPHSNPLNTEVHSTMQYWMDVKKEIEQL